MSLGFAALAEPAPVSAPVVPSSANTETLLAPTLVT